MTLTRDFKETTQARAERDPEYRAELLKGALEDLLVGEVEMGLAQLRDYITPPWVSRSWRVWSINHQKH